MMVVNDVLSVMYPVESVKVNNDLFRELLLVVAFMHLQFFNEN